MKPLNELIRPSIQNLTPYSSARFEFEGDKGVFLNANESPFGTLNRYPDPLQLELKMKLSKLKNMPVDSIFIGNGSDEIIDLVYRVFCEPAKEKALTFSPTYGMYQVSAAINNVELIQLPLTSSFEIDLQQLRPYYKNSSLKVIWICSPNNPTGNSIALNTIESILKAFNGILVVDEAYIDFSDKDSAMQLINGYSNLIVCQTLSKAWGLAAARVGIMYSNKEIIDCFNKVKPPYNVSTPNQIAAIEALSNKESTLKNIEYIKKERKNLINQLNKIDIVETIFPTDANFILVKVKNATEQYNYLVNKGVITRNRTNQIKDTLRITIGTQQENAELINALKKAS